MKLWRRFRNYIWENFIRSRYCNCLAPLVEMNTTSCLSCNRALKTPRMILVSKEELPKDFLSRGYNMQLYRIDTSMGLHCYRLMKLEPVEVTE